MTVLEILSKIEEKMEQAQSIKEVYIELGNEAEASAYNSVWCALYCLKDDIEKSLDEEASRAYEEMRAND